MGIVFGDPRRTWMSWAVMLMAISAGVSAWISRPMGAKSRVNYPTPTAKAVRSGLSVALSLLCST
ncbi:hypothetical protein NW843_08275, partial [Synechococcus sp. R5-12]